MKIITINVPEPYLAVLEQLVALGYYPSRSEACRDAIKRFLLTEQDFSIRLNSTLELDPATHTLGGPSHA